MTGAERVLAAVAATRAGEPLPDGEIAALIADFLAGRVTDYQMSAWLATVAGKGLSRAETVALTRAYVDSGVRLDHSALGRPVVDKHSTGGVGDKVSLVVVPMVAACGVPVVKLSGRGLSFLGGTVDKLESFRGLRMDLAADEVTAMLRLAGLVISGQSDDLVPGDRATYELRDVTGSVRSLPLIAASVMSKKIAAGAHGVVLDVKYGSGALLADEMEARALAELMVDIGRDVGMPCHAVLSEMSVPLGRCIGNALEVREAIRALRGEPLGKLTELCRTIAALMLTLAEPGLSRDDAEKRVQDAVDSGAALEALRRWLAAQGGDVRQVDDPELLPRAARQVTVSADRAGWVSGVDPRALGEAAAQLGAGRFRYDDRIDHAVGIELLRTVGDEVRPGDPLAVVHVNPPAKLDTDRIRAAFTLTTGKPADRPVVGAIIEAR
ncbi:thymidine phosphorylase [Micromonospora sp. DT43]|uniref:thymidine phosphorylase n=1 Tax=Micromonospora sp. DT43 TaxID=3393440 RepID=UPI003CFA6AD4